MADLQTMSDLQLETASQEALKKKDTPRFVAIQEEKLRRKGAPTAAEIQARASTAEPEAKGLRVRVRWWQILIALGVAIYLTRAKFIAAVVGGG